DYREDAAGHRRHRLGEKVDEGNEKKRKGDKAEAERNLGFADGEGQGHLEFALAGIGVAQEKNGQAVQRKTPDHAESVEVREEGHVTMANDNSEYLQGDNDVDDAVAGAEARVRLTKPVAQNAVFRDAIEHTVRADDRRIHCASQDDRAYHDHECMEDQAQKEWPLEAHGQAADKVFEEALADVVRNDHHREERNQRSEDHAVDENDQPGLFQVDEFRAFDFAID